MRYNTVLFIFYLLNISIIFVFGCFSASSNQVEEDEKLPIAQQVIASKSSPNDLTNDEKKLIDVKSAAEIMAKSLDKTLETVIQNESRIDNINEKNTILEKIVEQQIQERQLQQEQQQKIADQNSNETVDETIRLNSKFVEVRILD